ncbi:MAG: DUF5715 family protein [Candidatus Saccharimonadales bacterium]
MLVSEAIPTPEGQLKDFYNPADYSDAEARAVLEDIHQGIAFEQAWFAESGRQPLATDMDVDQAVQRGKLIVVEDKPGIRAIPRLRNQFEGYSPPYLTPRADAALEAIGQVWADAEGSDADNSIWQLPVTSMVRSTTYQARLATLNPRQPSVNPADDEHSSHEFGEAFDLDGCGLYLTRQGVTQAIHARMPHDNWDKLDSSRKVLKEVLAELERSEAVHVVEEMPETTRWVYHICVNPLMSAHGIVKAIRQLHAS